MPDWIDAHCHLTEPELGPRLRETLADSRAAGVTGWILGGVGPEDWEQQLELEGLIGPRVVMVFGLHPWWVASHDRAEVETAIGKLSVQLKKAKALGELGLDFSPAYISSKVRQVEVFHRLLDLAKDNERPVVLHLVRAHGDGLEALRGVSLPAGGLVHGFSGSLEIAERYLDLGLCLSIGPGVMREGFQKLKNSVKFVPPDRLLLETDEHPPADLLRVAEAVAGILGRTSEEVLTQTAENARRLFRME